MLLGRRCARGSGPPPHVDREEDDTDDEFP